MLYQISEWLSSLRSQNYSKRTVANYGTQARALAKHLRSILQREPDAGDFTEGHLAAFLLVLSETYQPGSRHTIITILRQFGNYLKESGKIVANPALNLKWPKKTEKERVIPNAEMVAALLSACDRLEPKARCVLARAVVTLFITSGIRRSELLSLRQADIDLRGRRLHIKHGKGNKERSLRLHAAARAALMDYLEMRPQVRPGSRADGRLFIWNQVNPLGHRALTNLFRQVKAIAGLRDDPACDPHTLRHYCATALLGEGWDVKTVQEILGHLHAKTTLDIYCHTDESRKGRAIDSLKLPGQAPVSPAAQAEARMSRERDPNKLLPRSNRHAIKKH